MIVYFTRHGESEANRADREGRPWSRDLDRLSERGWEQARGVGERLRSEGIEAIIASPFKRARETAQAIGEVLGLGFEVDEDLHEVVQSDAYRAAAPDYAGTGTISWMVDAPTTYAEPGAESFEQIMGRVTRVQERLEARRDRALCVSHWGFLHFFLGSALFREDFGPGHLVPLYRISHANTGITIFERREHYLIDGIPFDGWALRTWNDQGHL